MEFLKTSIHRFAGDPRFHYLLQLIYTEGTQDSLSFLLLSTANDVHVPFEPPSEVPNPPCQNEIIQLRGDNKLLREHLSELSEQYYQWKVACIFTVDKNRQMAIEMDKINKEYKQHNMMRDFGSHHGHIQMICSLGMRFQQRE
jgi:hypothetical protein